MLCCMSGYERVTVIMGVLHLNSMIHHYIQIFYDLKGNGLLLYHRIFMMFFF